MNYLLDTHVLIWARLDPDKLSAIQRDIIENDHSDKFISTVSIWEISLKFGLEKLSLGGHTPEEFLRSSVRLGYKTITPTPAQFAAMYRLPATGKHKDPFDRMLVWQAIRNNMALLSHDTKLKDYTQYGLEIA